MFENFRKFFKRKSKKGWIFSDKNITMVPGSSAEITILGSTPSKYALTLYNNGETIMTIGKDGRLKWHKEDAADEAVAIFAEAFTMRVEDETGIKQNRKEWELRITKALARRAVKEPLTPEVLTEVVRKCILLDTLKGIK